MSVSALLVFTLLACATATQVDPCKGKSGAGLSEDVQLTPCKKIPCRLKKNTSTHIKIKFMPDSDLDEIKNHVTANVFGVDLPFVGVDGNSVCDKIETESGEKVPCPLKAGNTYVYKDSFPILAFYPSIEVKVHWALQHKNLDVKCFEIPAKIV